MISTARATPFSARILSPNSSARLRMRLFAVTARIAAANRSVVSFFCGTGSGPAPKAWTRLPQKSWSPKLEGKTAVGLPAHNPSAVVPAPPFFSRMLVYPLIGVGAWRHRLDLVAVGVALEALLWTAVPPRRRDVRIRRGRDRDGVGLAERTARDAEVRLLRPVGPTSRGAVRWPVEALLASVGRRRIRRRLLLPHGPRRRRSPIVEAGLIDLSSCRVGRGRRRV